MEILRTNQAQLSREFTTSYRDVKMCSSHKVHSALIEEHGIMKAFIHTPSMKPTVVVFWLGLEPQRGAIVPGSLMIKYAGSCQNNSRYLKSVYAGTLANIVLHSELESSGRKGIT